MRLLTSLALGFLTLMNVYADPYSAERAKARKLWRDGNQKEAFEAFTAYLKNPDIDPAQGAEDLNASVNCLAQMGENNKLDGWLEEMAKAHGEKWQILAAVAQACQNAESYGFMINGEFERGGHRGGGKAVNSRERDRIRAMQWMAKALPMLDKEENQAARDSFYMRFADMIMNGRGWQSSWELQALSDLTTLPDYEEGGAWWGWRGRGRSDDKGAAVDTDGNPVYHHKPDSWEAAKSDGERWRWLLGKVGGDVEKRQLADFMQQQLDVQTLARWSWFFNRQQPDEQSETRKDTSGIWELHKLSDKETIARLANGIRRFELPDEFNFIRMYTELKDWDKLAEIMTNRRQYPRAADYWRQSIREYGDGPHKHKQEALDQIVQSWGRFENTELMPAGKPAELLFRFRNGKKVTLEAWQIDTEKLLLDIKEYLKSNPAQLDWEKMQIHQIGHQIVMGKAEKYRGELMAKWDQDLDPLPNHFDRRVTVPTPLKKAGAYLVRSQMEGGNECYIVLWLADLAIVKKPFAAAPGDKGKGGYYFIADAITGEPIPGAEAEFFGYWGEPIRNATGRRWQNIHTTRFSIKADEQGQVIPDTKDLIPSADHRSPQYLVTARTKDGRMAFFGFDSIWLGQWHDSQYNEIKYYGITDRPVYRPEQKVEFKAWIRQAQYDMPDTSPFAGKEFQINITDPQGNEVYKKQIQADEFSGVADSYDLPKGAPLGVYTLTVNRNHAVTFRVEEYKKPEFEVKVDAPSEPVQLGDKVDALVTAKYYFGAPVTQARVKVKVERTAYASSWYAPRPWDWCFGVGYGWFAWDYVWWPGWYEWGCSRPAPWWISGPTDPPELVQESESEIGPDGTVKVSIDTAIAKAMHADQDHRYTLTVEVTDESRRTIVGSGAVLVARKPFKVFTWVDRGHYQVGNTIHAEMQARTLDGKPVKGEGVLRLLAVTHGKNDPEETLVQTWELNTDAQGRASQQISASKAGQYRLSYTVVDGKGRSIEGGYVFVIRGEGEDSRKYRFNQLELIADKREYASDDKVRLVVNADRPDSTVVLFARPSNGVYLMPQVLRLKGKTAEVEIPLSKRDMPNFFVEAFTISDGKVHTQSLEIIVPPEQRVANLEIIPSALKYLPGEEAEVELRLRDLQGEPIEGALVLSAYDRSVEYIAGPNVSEIKEFFWKWRRSHNVQMTTSLAQGGWPMVAPEKPGMNALGVFGHSVADEGTVSTRQRVPPAEMRNGGMLAKGMPRMTFSAEAPVPALAPAARGLEEASLMVADKVSADFAGGGAGEAGGTEVEPGIRSEFADTAYWNAILRSDSNGIARVTFKMPDNLTGWKLRGWAMGHGTRVGEGTAEVVTSKNLMLRLQAPRFFVEKDEVVLSANVHNYLDAEKKVRVLLELEGGSLESLAPAETTVAIQANGEKRVDWRVKVLREGTAIVRMKALTDVESDAMEMRFPVYVHGMLKTESFSRAIRPDGEHASIAFQVPEEIRPNESVLEVRWSPTLAGAMVDALPYLVEYPYGCTEQTLSRFLPTVLTHKILQGMGVDMKALREKRTNLNAQEIGDDAERAKQWKRYDRNPVFDEEEVARMAREGLKRIYDMQCSDGGWGWFSGSGEYSWAHTTAHVVHGLQIAQAAGLDVSSEVLGRGIQWLKRYQANETRRIREEKARDHKPGADAMDAFAFMILADADQVNEEMLGYLYRDRVDLPVYAKAMFGLALDTLKRVEQRDMLIRNIEQFLVADAENQTAYLKLNNGGYWWYWYGSEYEAQAYYLKLLCRTDPRSEKASGLVKYLLNNRKHATYWSSTRDTAICIEAMAEYIRASGEDKPRMVVEVLLDGKKLKEVEITPENLFTFDNKLVLFGDAVVPGEHVLDLRRKGSGPLYSNVYLTYFSLEDHIPRAGLEIKVDRKVYRLVPEDKEVNVQGHHGQVVGQKVEKFKRLPLEDGAMLKSGELVEVELSLESKNDYEYLVFEDYKAAGFEAVDLRSGYTGNEMGAYVEFRDERVAFFVRALARGKHSVSYRLRAEIPGRFSALPARGYAMYAPELKANSDEIKLNVED